MEDRVLKILPNVENPQRYLGREINVYRKNFFESKVRFALCYPDLYEIGMSSLGFRIIYGLLNEMEDVVCERFFAPYHDMESIMIKEKIPLFTLESKIPVKDFDFVGFSISSELNYTNFINLLHLSQIPIFAKERDDGVPIVIVGGNCAFNPFPLFPFVDLFIIGEGEEVIKEIVEVFKDIKGRPRAEILEELSNIEGVLTPLKIKKVKKRIVKNLDESFFPVRWVVPLTEIIHDRITLEIMRGCVQRCKFCQAGACWKPVRIRSPERILQLAKSCYKNSGYEEISLLSFSSGDHPQIEKIVDLLLKEFGDKKVSISFPSLRIDTFSFELANKIKMIRKTGLTFAPESSERLRMFMGKNIKDEEIISLSKKARDAGWRQIKLYFMIGLPGENDGDIDEITRLIIEISRIITVKASFNTFIPKPHTPLEKERFITKDEFEYKRNLIVDKLKKKRYVKFNFHKYEMSCVEAFLGRGDERIANVIYRAWEDGARMENWKENFDFGKWEKGFLKEGIDMKDYTEKVENLPWKFIILN